MRYSPLHAIKPDMRYYSNYRGIFCLSFPILAIVVVMLNSVTLSVGGANCQSNNNQEHVTCPRQCQHGGTLMKIKGECRCSCPDEYSGTLCQKPKPTAHCRNCVYGFPKESDSGCACDCFYGYKARRCQAFDKHVGCLATECETNEVLVCPDPKDECCCCKPCRICENGGIAAFDETDNCICNCPVGFQGNNCQAKDIDMCASAPCRNNGTCIDGVNMYTCNCLPGYEGFNCEIEPCRKCKNGGTAAWNEKRKCICQCPSGYVGKKCQFKAPVTAAPVPSVAPVTAAPVPTVDPCPSMDSLLFPVTVPVTERCACPGVLRTCSCYCNKKHSARMARNENLEGVVQNLQNFVNACLDNFTYKKNVILDTL